MKIASPRNVPQQIDGEPGKKSGSIFQELFVDMDLIKKGVLENTYQLVSFSDGHAPYKKSFLMVFRLRYPDFYQGADTRYLNVDKRWGNAYIFWA